MSRDKFLRKLGSGAYSNVYLYENIETGKQTVHKVIDMREISDKAKRRLDDEVSILLTLNATGKKCSQYVVCYTGMEQIDHLFTIMYDYVEGENMKKVLHSINSLPNKEEREHKKLDLIKKVAKALRYIHSHEVSHGDVKLENIIVDKEGTPRLIDFGFSCYNTTDNIRNRCNCSAVKGTPHYMAPEVLNRSCRAGEYDKVDVFAFGILVYRTLTGSYIYEAPKRSSLFRNIRQGKHEPIDTGNPNLNRLIEDCISSNPEKRPSMANVCRRLDRIISVSTLIR